MKAHVNRLVKQSLLLGAAIVMLAGCSRSPEKKVTSLVEKIQKQNLYFPDSYDPIATRVDSAFTPFDDPAFYKKTIKLLELSRETENVEFEMKHAKSDMSSWASASSEYGRNEYAEAKKEYEEYLEQHNALQEKMEALVLEMKSDFDQGRKFIGWKATHSFRAKNNSGQVLIGEGVYLIDPEMKTVIAAYDAEDPEYQDAQKAFEMVQDKWTED